jgi:hypothetical protein
MVKIYAQAEGTFVWLGEQNAASSRSFDLILKFVKAKIRLGEDYTANIL